MPHSSTSTEESMVCLSVLLKFLDHLHLQSEARQKPFTTDTVSKHLWRTHTPPSAGPTQVRRSDSGLLPFLSLDFATRAKSPGPQSLRYVLSSRGAPAMAMCYGFTTESAIANMTGKAVTPQSE